MLALHDAEDAAAAVDLNLVMNAAGEFIELQSTGEEASFSEAQLQQMLTRDARSANAPKKEPHG